MDNKIDLPIAVIDSGVGGISVLRELIKIMPEDEAATLRMFETLLGDDILSRKAFITEHGAEYIDLADI